MQHCNSKSYIFDCAISLFPLLLSPKQFIYILINLHVIDGSKNFATRLRHELSHLNFDILASELYIRLTRILFFRLFSKEALKKDTGAAVSAATARESDLDSDEELYQPTFAITRYTGTRI